MTTLSSDIVRITDNSARLDPEWAQDPEEPLPGSVVLINGEWGSAFQRYFSDNSITPSQLCGGGPWESLVILRR